jgi:HAD domain family 1 in Swiss Army Knife RNA repair proteins
LVQTSKELFQDPEALTVLLTGRSTAYIDLISRILKSKELHFDLVVLKPKKERFESNSTLTFKYAFIDDILNLGESIDHVEVYEDRAPHRDAFEKYLKNWRRLSEPATHEDEYDGIKVQSVELAEQNDAIGLKEFKVHFVTMPFIHLDEAVEESLIQDMLEETNEVDMANDLNTFVLEKKIFNVSYVVPSEDIEILFNTYLPMMNDKLSDRHEWRQIRQPSVFIHFNALPPILNKVGGIGKRVEFEITHLGVSDKVLALSLVPVASFHEVLNESGEKVLQQDSRTRYWSKNEVPVLVLATRDGGKPIDANYLQEWRAIPKSIEYRRFIATVTAKQEIDITQVSKVEARARKEAAARSQEKSSAPRKHHSGQFKDSHENRKNGYAGNETSGGNHTIYGNSRGRGTRNAFGYSLR